MFLKTWILRVEICSLSWQRRKEEEQKRLLEEEIVRSIDNLLLHAGHDTVYQ